MASSPRSLGPFLLPISSLLPVRFPPCHWYRESALPGIKIWSRRRHDQSSCAERCSVTTRIRLEGCVATFALGVKVKYREWIQAWSSSFLMIPDTYSFQLCTDAVTFLESESVFDTICQWGCARSPSQDSSSSNRLRDLQGEKDKVR